jgi:hypothetical protein
MPKKGKSPNTFKARGSNPKATSSKKGFLPKGPNPKGLPMGNQKEHVSIATKWDIIPKIAPNLNSGMGVQR